MKVLMINGSPRANGNTSIALNEMKTVFEKEGVDAEIVQVGSEAVRGCIACNRCAELGVHDRRRSSRPPVSGI